MSSLTLSCPQCHHGHDIPEHYFAEQPSRLLKCAGCGHVWRYSTTEMPEYERRLRDLLPQETAMDPHPSQSMSLNSQKQIYKKAVHHYHLDWWLLVIACITAGLVLFVEVGTIPNFDWLYTQSSTFVRSLFQKISPYDTALRNDVSLHVLASTLEGSKESPILIVKGEIHNTSTHTYVLPIINVHLMDTKEDGNLATRCTWAYQSNALTIEPGEKRPFETQGDAKSLHLPSSILLQFKQDVSL